MNSKKILYTAFFLFFIYCILTHSELSLYYALSGLELWFGKMIPSLLPFMILSGIMVRLELTQGFASVLYPIINPIFRVSKNGCYVIIIGFLCGFPMGAKTVADLYSDGKLSRQEAEYLLAFCNNIGPVYFLSFALPLLHRKLVFPYLFGMYGLPLLYGIILRNSVYKEYKTITARELVACETPLCAIDDAITSSLQSILKLGGYMIVFNMLNLLPHVLTGKVIVFTAPLFEITGGLNLLGHRLPLYILLLLPFGGFSCLAQTNSCIRGTDLSIRSYTVHKIVLTMITGLYYLLWLLCFPKSFLR